MCELLEVQLLIYIYIFKYRHLNDTAMNKGYVEPSLTNFLITGAAGVEKTHPKDLLLHPEPPEQSAGPLGMIWTLSCMVCLYDVP